MKSTNEHSPNPLPAGHGNVRDNNIPVRWNRYTVQISCICIILLFSILFAACKKSTPLPLHGAATLDTMKRREPSIVYKKPPPPIHVIDSVDLPIAPFVIYGLTPMEMGEIKYIVSIDSLKVFSEFGDTSSILCYTSVSDTLYPDSFNVIVEKIGICIVDSMVKKYKPNDTIYIVNYICEGAFRVWFQYEYHITNSFWKDDPFWKDRKRGHLIEKPQLSWWVHFKNKRNETGWLRFKNKEPDGFIYHERIDIHDTYWNE